MRQPTWLWSLKALGSEPCLAHRGFNISPCTGAKRPTLELSEARAVIDMAGILPPPLKPYAFRRHFRFDSGLAYVCLKAEPLMPWVKLENWCRAPCSRS